MNARNPRNRRADTDFKRHILAADVALDHLTDTLSAFCDDDELAHLATLARELDWLFDHGRLSNATRRGGHHKG